MIMNLAIFVLTAVLAVSVWGGLSLAAGPSPGNGPWTACSNNSSVCARQLGSDVNPDNEVFDCWTRNGRLGHALQSSNTGSVKCWAN